MDDYIYDIKDCIDSLVDLIKEADGTSNACLDLGINLPVDEFVVAELSMFALYLFASDGKITDSEADLFNKIFDKSLSTKEIRQAIIDADIYTHEFESRPPLAQHVAAHSEAYTLCILGKRAPVSEQIINLYSLLGQMLIECDADLDASETRDLNIYLTMLDEQSGNLRLNYMR